MHCAVAVDSLFRLSRHPTHGDVATNTVYNVLSLLLERLSPFFMNWTKMGPEGYIFLPGTAASLHYQFYNRIKVMD